MRLDKLTLVADMLMSISELLGIYLTSQLALVLIYQLP